MRKGKKLISFLLAWILLLGYSMTTTADATAKHTITIINEKAGHVYQAYQIFKGDLDTGKTILSNIEWGEGVDGDSLLAALQEQEAYRTCTAAKDVADVLKGYGDDSEALETFAETAERYLSETIAGTSAETESPYTISVTGDGYYLVKDAGEIGQGDAYTKFILRVVKDVQVKAKADAPILEKHIVDETGLVEANSASVGDKVEYLITSRVPAMDGYEKYFFVVHDNLDDGMTFLSDTVQVKVGDQTLSTTDYDLLTDETEDNCTFEIVFHNFIQYKEKAGAAVSISYQACVNKQAEMGNIGNANRAHLEYSNNPNVAQEGSPDHPDKPGIGDVTGVTPDDITITYITGLELLKVTDGEEQLPLQGAVFAITGDRLNQMKVTKGVYTEDAQGSYYKLKDGTYTEQAPLDETRDRYESEDKLYVLETVTEWTEGKETVHGEAAVDINGELRFYGLAAGTYQIREIIAPNGYNLLENPIEVEITLCVPETIEDGLEEAEWKYSVKGAFTQEEQTAEDGMIHLTVVNKAGTILPSTGGNGIYVFYLIGILAAITAIVHNLRQKQRNEAR